MESLQIWETEIKEEPLEQSHVMQCAPARAPYPCSKEVRIVLDKALCWEQLKTTNTDPGLEKEEDQFQTMNVKNYFSSTIQENATPDPSIFYSKNSLNYEIQYFHQNILEKCNQNDLDNLKKEYIEQLHKVCNLEVFKCMVCKYETIHKHNIKLHLFLVHNTTLEYKIWKCVNCDYIGTDSTLMKNHLEIHHQKENELPLENEQLIKDNVSLDQDNTENDDNCSDSERNFGKTEIRQTGKRKWRKNKTNQKPTLKCPICPYTYPHKASMLKHIKTHRDIQCSICDYIANGNTDIRKHKLENHQKITGQKTTRKKTSSYTFQCDACRFKTDNAYHWENHSTIHKHNINGKTDGLWHCPECEYKIKNVKYLTLHICNSHREPRKIGYICEICGRSFDSCAQLNSHKISHKTIEDLDEVFECFNCGHKSKSKRLLQRHIREKHMNHQPKYVCKICGLESKRRYNHMNHVKIHEKSPNNVFKCKACAYETHIKRYMAKHMKYGKHFVQNEERLAAKKAVRKKTRKKPRRIKYEYHCSSCEFKALYWQNMGLHFKKAHPDIPKDTLKVQLKCTKCDFQCAGRNAQGVIYTHIENSHPESLTFICDLCDFKSDSLNSLELHKEGHTNEENENKIINIYHCNDCKHNTLNKFDYEQHKRRHQKFRIEKSDYQCLHCDFSTGNRKKLIEHLITHKSAFQCPQCPFKTNRNYSYLQHINMHKNSKKKTLPKCKVCSALFKCKQNLNQHMQRSHPNEDNSVLLKCNLCDDYQTKVVQYLQLHLRTMHKLPKLGGEYKKYCTVLDGSEIKQKHRNKGGCQSQTKNMLFQCKFCVYKTASYNNLSQHLSRMHKSLLKFQGNNEKTKYKQYATIVDLNETENDKENGNSGPNSQHSDEKNITDQLDTVIPQLFSGSVTERVVVEEVGDQSSERGQP